MCFNDSLYTKMITSRWTEMRMGLVGGGSLGDGHHMNVVMLETWQQIIIAACETLLLGIGRIGHAADTTDRTNNSLLVVHISAVCSVLST